MPQDQPLTLTISPESARALRESIASGEYECVEDAVADALSTWQQRHEDRAEELAWVKARVRASLLDPRPSLSMAEVRAHMDQVFRNATRQDDAAG